MTEQARAVATEERPVRVRDLMSAAPYSISEDESLLMAWELLERSGQRYVPVLRKDGRCTGVLGRAELAMACAAPGTVLSRRRLCDLVRGRRTSAVHAEDSMRHAAVVMTENGTDALPVTDEHGRLAGLLTAQDYVVAAAGLPPRAEPAPGTSPISVLPGLPPRPWTRDEGIPIP